MEIQCLIFSFSRLKQFFRRLLFFLFMYHGDIRLRNLTRWVSAIIFISMWQTHAQQQNITFCWKKLRCFMSFLCVTLWLVMWWKKSAIFWTFCLNLNVWLFPSGIEFISVLIFFLGKSSLYCDMWRNHMVSVGKQNKIAVTIIVSIETFTVNETNKSNCLPLRPNETLMFEYVFNIEKCGLDFWNRSEKHEQSLSVVSLALKSLCALKSNRLNYVCYYALESK